MKLKVEGSSPLSSVLTLLLYLSTLFHRVYSLVCPQLLLASPRSPCLPTNFSDWLDLLFRIFFIIIILFIIPVPFSYIYLTTSTGMHVVSSVLVDKPTHRVGQGWLGAIVHKHRLAQRQARQVKGKREKQIRD